MITRTEKRLEKGLKHEARARKIAEAVIRDLNRNPYETILRVRILVVGVALAGVILGGTVVGVFYQIASR